MHRHGFYGNRVGQFLTLDQDTKDMLQYLCKNVDDVAEELQQIKCGEIITGKFDMIKGFEAFLNDELKVTLFRHNDQKYMADLHFYYKELRVMSAKIIPDNDHWNGNVEKVELFDGYERGKDSRHDLEKSFHNYAKWMNDKIYTPHILKEKKQELHKDNLFDEYIQTI